MGEGKAANKTKRAKDGIDEVMGYGPSQRCMSFFPQLSELAGRAERAKSFAGKKGQGGGSGGGRETIGGERSKYE